MGASVFNLISHYGLSFPLHVLQGNLLAEVGGVPPWVVHPVRLSMSERSQKVEGQAEKERTENTMCRSCRRLRVIYTIYYI